MKHPPPALTSPFFFLILKNLKNSKYVKNVWNVWNVVEYTSFPHSPFSPIPHFPTLPLTPTLPLLPNPCILLVIPVKYQKYDVPPYLTLPPSSPTYFSYPYKVPNI